MNINCPHCGTEYDIAQHEFGKFVTCQVCGRGFVAGANSQNKSATHDDQPSKSNGSSAGRMSAARPQEKDSIAYRLGKFSPKNVTYVTPVLAKVIQFIGYVLAVIIGVVLFVSAMQYNPLVALIVVPLLFVLLCLSIRLWYEFVIVVFDGVACLRQIRDELHLRKCD